MPRLTLAQRLAKGRREYERAYRSKKRTKEIAAENAEIMRRILRKECAQDRRAAR